MPKTVDIRANGHSSEVSRWYYLARFQGTNLDEFARDQFKAAFPETYRDNYHDHRHLHAYEPGFGYDGDGRFL